MANPSGPVKFMWIPSGQTLPATPDKDTVYFEEDTSTLYVGDHAFGVSVQPLTTTEVTAIVNSIT